MSAETTSGGQEGEAAEQLVARLAEAMYPGADPLGGWYDAARRAVAALPPLVLAREAPTDDAALTAAVGVLRPALVALIGATWNEAGPLAEEVAQAVLPVVTRAVAGRARREALEAREAGYQEALSDVRAAGDLPASQVATDLAMQPAPATDDTEGESRGR